VQEDMQLGCLMLLSVEAVLLEVHLLLAVASLE
jgi:hypothetical protein